MKIKLLITLALAASVAVIAAVFPKANKDKESLTLQVLMAVLERLHFAPQKIDDSLSQEIYKEYLDGMDSSKRFLLGSEVEQLAIYKNNIDEQIDATTFEFFNLTNTLMESGIKRAQRVYQSIIDQEISITSSKTLELDGEKTEYVSTEAKLAERWTDYITYHVVTRYESYLSDRNKSDDPFDKEKTDKELLAKATKNSKEMFDDWFKRLDDIRRSDRYEAYLNVVTHTYDPHTDYYSPKAKEDFDLKMGGRLEGIGARLFVKDDLTEVSTVIVGGPAWKGKELAVEDKILQVRQDNEEEPTDLTGMRIDDVVQLIRGKKGTNVHLTIRKKSGKTLVITIERDEVIVDESFARSVVVDFEDVKNIGFISLPVFYSTFDGKNSCAEDVKKEVEKLNAQNVNGIILDLRWNGGGSLQDVIDMSGLFIEEGPIVQVQSGDGKASVYKDRDNSVSYDGPMIVMTNMVSASASEILAGALQDYGRAVIVGSNSTFGKGTVQGFYDLDRVYNGSSDLKPLGQVKMTTQKFYRINGGSNQLTGIIPDIILPDNFSYVNVGEKEYDNALEWSKIDPVKYEQNVYQLPDLNTLKQNSSERVAASNIFNLIDDNAQYIKEVENDSDVPLSLKGYKAYLAEREARAEKYDNIMKNPIDGLSISNLATDLDYIQADSSRIARNEDWLKGLHKDVYLQETVLIMKDMINGEQ